MGSVSLAKNQTVSLSKQSGSSLTNLHFGLGWDAAKKGGFLSKIIGNGGGEIDLDASVVTLDASGKRLDTVWFRQKTSNCGAVKHSGDNLTGDGDGDDEIIKVNLTKLPSNVEYLAFTVNSFRGQTFNEVDNAFCRVLDQHDKELVKFELSEKGSHTGIIIASLRRNGGQWDFTAHGHASKGRTIDDMMGDIQAQVVR
ncbi:TerD family protein [Aeromonas salmonicida]